MLKTTKITVWTNMAKGRPAVGVRTQPDPRTNVACGMNEVSGFRNRRSMAPRAVELIVVGTEKRDR